METNELTVGDVTRMALTMEEKGKNFYTWAARKFDDREVVDMFHRLAEEEKEHARIFNRLLDLPDANQKIAPTEDRYLKMLAGADEVFPKHHEVSPEQVKTPSDALAFGIQAEKDSILFYQELYNKTDSPQVKEALSKLLEEEKMHLVVLRDTMNEMVQ